MHVHNKPLWCVCLKKRRKHVSTLFPFLECVGRASYKTFIFQMCHKKHLKCSLGNNPALGNGFTGSIQKTGSTFALLFVSYFFRNMLYKQKQSTNTFRALPLSKTGFRTLLRHLHLVSNLSDFCLPLNLSTCTLAICKLNTVINTSTLTIPMHKNMHALNYLDVESKVSM